MMIRKVRLKNIKSYKSCEIEISEGIIGISGLNGAGKSTILEAIGYALFDCLPYTQSEFVRKGEKNGEISVTITGSDELEYTIVRKCGSSQAYYLYDSLGNKLEGKDDVGAKLCEILGYNVTDFTQLRSLFENAVGVLQGTFVSEFLESPGKRKAIFDPLLRIEEYNTAYKNIMPLKVLVKDRIDAMGRDISYLQGKSSRLEPVSLEKEELTKENNRLKAILASRNDELKEVKIKKERMDLLENEIRELDGKSKVASLELDSRKRDLANAKMQLDICEAARKKLAENEAQYNRYMSRVAEKESLEKKRNERDQLLSKQSSLNARIVEISTRLKEHDKSLAEILKCEKDVELLKPLASEQERLELEKENLMSQLKAKENELSQINGRKRSVKCSSGNICPIFNVECKSIPDFTTHFESEIKRIESQKSQLENQIMEIIEKIKDMGNPKLKLSVNLESVKKKDRLLKEKQKDSQDLSALNEEQEKLLSSLIRFNGLEESIKAVNNDLASLKPSYDEYQQNIRLAKTRDEWLNKYNIASLSVVNAEKDLERINRAIEDKLKSYDAEAHRKIKASYESLSSEVASITAKIESVSARLISIDNEILEIRKCLNKIDELNADRAIEERYLKFIDLSRNIIKEAGPEVARVYIELISKEATSMYCEIAGDNRIEIKWTPDYDIILIEDGRERTFKQLSGGEQMSAALAVRLAILKILTDSDIVFLDEPTQNMDENRRQNLAHEIMRIKDFKQMVVISHDDTFNANLENVIEIEKVGGESMVRGHG